MPDVTEDRKAFLSEIRRDLAEQTPGAVALQPLLERLLAGLEASVGTIHGVEPSGDLILLASRGLDPELTNRVQRIPPGKGLAGLAALRLAPVDVCNLQTDTSGQAKPAAKQTGAAASIAIPMLVDGKLRGVLGIALTEEHDFDEDEKQFLLDLAAVTGTVVA
jgi:signal transduction protein with GAF and PtsI domain